MCTLSNALCTRPLFVLVYSERNKKRNQYPVYLLVQCQYDNRYATIVNSLAINLNSFAEPDQYARASMFDLDHRLFTNNLI